MPSLPKFFLPENVYFVTFRTEEGLPFVPTELMNAIIYSVILRAQLIYPNLELVAIDVQLNHVHLLFVCIDPESIPLWVGYFKQETAHAINALLGYRVRTVWADGYDSPVLLTPDRVVYYLAYLFCNGVSANLYESPDDQPGVSSWRAFKDGTATREVSLFPRSSIEALRDPTRPHLESKAKLEALKEKHKLTGKIKYSHYAWKRCFDETRDLSDEEIRNYVVEKIYESAKLLKEARTKSNLSVLGAQNLKRSSMLRKYRPKKFGRKIIAISSDIDLRKAFLTGYKHLCEKAKEVYARWKKGDFSVPFPPGLFPPRMPRLLNPLPDLLRADWGP